MSVRIINGDCREVLKTLPSASIDSIVTDPPYELGFMGKKWDGTGIAFDAVLWGECLRVLKPGGHLLAFSGTRTQHRMVCAIEDAGFEIRDQAGWMYGSGFPKSHNGAWGGTALKPAWEPICVARKPLVGTVEANWRAHGTGALNIEACRVDADDGATTARKPSANGGAVTYAQDEYTKMMLRGGRGSELGRWPANLLHDGSDEVVALFPHSEGQQVDISDTAPSAKTGRVYGAMRRQGEASQNDTNEGAVGFKMKPGARRHDDGSAARFFWCPKASRADRNDGCEGGLPEKIGGMVSNTSGQHMTRRDGGAPGPRANHHPTVKPTELMRYLCRLVTPAGGLVLDPFMGSGSTLKAAELEGLSAIGIELDPEYVAIAQRRIAADAPLFADVEAA